MSCTGLRLRRCNAPARDARRLLAIPVRQAYQLRPGMPAQPTVETVEMRAQRITRGDATTLRLPRGGGRPRACLVLPHVILGGGETAMMAIAEGLESELALDVCALDYAPTGGAPTVREELAARFGAVTLARERWQLRPRFAAADVVLWYGVTNTVPAALAALAARGGRRPASVRVVHTEREVDGPGFSRRWRQVIDAVICVSPGMARRIAGAIFIPNTCSLERLRGRRQELFPAASPRRRTLGWAGRLVPGKNVPWLIDHLAAIGCNLALQALDSPWLTAADLERQAAARGVADRIRFLPPGRDLGTLLRSVDALVVASDREGFPMVVVEAGMLGVPVISTRVGALPELFADEILFVDGDGGVPEVAGLRRALAAAGPAWGEALHARVARLCARDAVVSRYLAVVAGVLGAGPRDAD
jgi:glycosyltransferase involved in cell wall biosynthesis